MDNLRRSAAMAEQQWDKDQPLQGSERAGKEHHAESQGVRHTSETFEDEKARKERTSMGSEGVNPIYRRNRP